MFKGLLHVEEEKFYLAAVTEFPDRLRELVGRYDRPDILELGGGRRPSFALAEMPANVNSYTVNDISEAELALASPEYRTACFDVTGDVGAFEGRYDVIFSHMLAEHVSDGRKLHSNVLRLLKPGGVAFHVMPTLYASPFVINKLLPAKLGRAIVARFFPYRRTAAPVFPAHYGWCIGNGRKMTEMLGQVGYSRIEFRNFYGHNYYRSLPGLRELDRLFAAIAARRGWSRYGSYAHLLAFK